MNTPEALNLSVVEWTALIAVKRGTSILGEHEATLVAHRLIVREERGLWVTAAGLEMLAKVNGGR